MVKDSLWLPCLEEASGDRAGGRKMSSEAIAELGLLPVLPLGVLPVSQAWPGCRLPLTFLTQPHSPQASQR